MTMYYIYSVTMGPIIHSHNSPVCSTEDGPAASCFSSPRLFMPSHMYSCVHLQSQDAVLDIRRFSDTDAWSAQSSSD